MATPTTSLPGIGEATALVLAEHGFRSTEDLAAADAEALAAVPGFGLSRAAASIAAARGLVGASEPAAGAGPETEQDVAPGKASKLGKKARSKKKGATDEKAGKRKKKGSKKKSAKGKKKSKKK